MKLTRFLYKAARASNDAQTLSSGDSRRIARRAKNKVLGRLLGRFWRVLWR